MAESQGTVWLTEEFGEWVRSLQEKYHIPGTSVAVVDNGRVESTGYGLARLPDVPATADTLYAMGSTAKAIAAATMGLILRDDSVNEVPNSRTVQGKSKKMSWQTPLVDVLGDDFDMGDPFLTQTVTIEDALSHRSGMAGHDFHYGPSFGHRGSDHTRALRHFGASREYFRTKFQYCNVMFGAIGHICEKLDGSFDAAARKRLFEPLGMNNTLCGFHSSAAPENGGPHLARGYHWVEDGTTENVPEGKADQGNKSKSGHYVSEGFVELGPIIGAAGGVLSSVNDYSKWVTALLEASETPNEHNKQTTGKSNSESQPPVISNDLWKELVAPRTIISPAMNPFADVNPNVGDIDVIPPVYALGWFSGPFMYADHTIIHHAGGIPGFGAHVFLLPKHKLGVVVASNTHMVSNKLAEQIGREIIGRKIGKSQDERRCEGDFTPKGGKPESVNESDKEKVPVEPLTADGPPKPTVEQEKPAGNNTDGLPDSFDPQAVLGVYENAAYGRYTVSIGDPLAALNSEKPSLDGVRILRKPSKSSDPKGESKHANLVLLAQPHGRRTLHHATLLHPPPAIVKSVQTAEHAFLTMDRLWPHGDLLIDPIPGLSRGLGKENDTEYPFKQEALWEGGAITPNVSCGACFTFEQGKAAKLGMILGNTQAMEAAMRQGDKKLMPLDNFESKMVWFEKVQ